MSTTAVAKNTEMRSVQSLEAELAAIKAQHAAMKQERDFWTEQARGFQNHLQIVLRCQGDILAQMAHSAVAPENVHAAIADMGEALRRPLTTVAAVEALAASCRPGTQGQYTATLRGKRNEIESR